MKYQADLYYSTLINFQCLFTTVHIFLESKQSEIVVAFNNLKQIKSNSSKTNVNFSSNYYLIWELSVVVEHNYEVNFIQIATKVSTSISRTSLSLEFRKILIKRFPLLLILILLSNITDGYIKSSNKASCTTVEVLDIGLFYSPFFLRYLFRIFCAKIIPTGHLKRFSNSPTKWVWILLVVLTLQVGGTSDEYAAQVPNKIVSGEIELNQTMGHMILKLRDSLSFGGDPAVGLDFMVFIKMQIQDGQFEQNSPFSINTNDEQVTQEDMLFEPSQPPRPMRPTSAKAPNPRFGKQKPRRLGRPISAVKKSSRPRGIRQESDMSFIHKIKPNRTNMDKERLYEENLALKMKVNMLSDQNLKLRTRYNQMEKEMNRKEDILDEMRHVSSGMDRLTYGQNLNSMHIVARLKQQVKDLREEVKDRDVKLNAMNRNIKATRIGEMEVELQAYIDECTRLRHHLEEVVKQRDEPSQINIQSYNEMQQQSQLLINQLKQENQEIKMAYNEVIQELNYLQERQSEIPKKKKGKKKSNESGLKNEVMKLKNQLKRSKEESKKKQAKLKEQVRQLQQHLQDKGESVPVVQDQAKPAIKANHPVVNFSPPTSSPPKEPVARKNPNPPKTFKRINKFIVTRRSDFSVILRSIDPERKGAKDILQIFTELRKIGIKLKQKDFLQDIEQLFRKDSGSIPLQIFEQAYNNYEYPANYDSSSSSSEQLPVVVEKPRQRPESANIRGRKVEEPNRPQVQEQLPVIQEAQKPPDMLPVVKASQIDGMLKHIAFKLQLHRIPKAKIQDTIFGPGASKQDITISALEEVFKQQPFSFDDNEKVNLLCRFLCEPDNATQIHKDEISKLHRLIPEIINKLSKNMEDWKVFEPQQEAEFDKQLGSVISQNKITIKEACKIYDSDNSGIITVSDFYEALEDLNIDFPEAIKKYLSLLFYSHKFSLNEVPYRHFIKAYGDQQNFVEEDQEMGEEDSLDDEERAKIVRNFLDVIAQGLKKNKKSVKDVFEADSKGLIYPDKFVKGLERLGVQIQQEDIIVILEALQYEEEENLICVLIDELQQILEHYGVVDHQVQPPQRSDSESSSDRYSHKSLDHVKKISMLESPPPDNKSQSSSTPKHILGESPQLKKIQASDKSSSDDEQFYEKYSSSESSRKSEKKSFHFSNKSSNYEEEPKPVQHSFSKNQAKVDSPLSESYQSDIEEAVSEGKSKKSSSKFSKSDNDESYSYDDSFSQNQYSSESEKDSESY